MNEKMNGKSRRSFCLKTASMIGSAFTGCNLSMAKSIKNPEIPLGFDNFSIRALGWKAPQFLTYAQSKKVDTVLFSDLDVYESFDSNYLNEIKQEGKRMGISIQAGTGGICPTSKSFKSKYGSAEEHLRLLIRVAKDVGSSVARCYLGTMKDRHGKGGIQQHITKTVQVLKKVKKYALDAGVKIAIENHAGDLHSLELVELIEQAGKDYVGATIDSGNATWTLENPVDTLRNLAPYAVSSGIRDSMVWKSENGVKVQWTAMGEGCTDLNTFTSEWKKLCPSLPMQLEIISGFAKEFAYLKDDFWPPYSNIPASGFSRFLSLSRRGKKIAPFSMPQDIDPQKARQEYQLAELERSLKYCKNVLGIGHA
ncbi:MAG: sugar phosphate isomerase/epimerase [Opitutae bacterium]|jgi:3-oxoisoapionate decarboxylase|nr:sugar phosphate isomerase/epimerase [Opitutae bacterium]